MTVTTMAEAYSKLFASITRSSIWLEDDQTLRVWVTMLALADRNGYVGASVGGLAAQARVPPEKTREALAKFLAPDPDSRSPEFEGRRIEVADRGWLILNYERFRDMRDEEAKREADRKRQRDHRRKKREERDAARMAPQPPPEPINDFDGSPNETACPPLLDDFERLVAPEMAKKLQGVTREQLTESANRFIAYYTIGKGMSQRRRFWMRELRNWVVKDHGAGKLAGPKRGQPRNAADALYARALAAEAEEKRMAANDPSGIKKDHGTARNGLPGESIFGR